MFRPVAILFLVFNLAAAKSCKPLSSSKAPFWKGMLPKFIPIDGADIRRAMLANPDGTSVAASECFGSMDLGRFQMTKLLKGTCLRTMNQYFESVNIFKNHFEHRRVVVQGTELMNALINSFGTEAFVDSLNALREFQQQFTQGELSNMCDVIRNDMVPCILDAFAPLLMKKFFSKSCCNGLRQQVEEKFGQPLDMSFIRRLATAATEILCSRRVRSDASSSVCVYEFIQAIGHDDYASDLVAMCSTAQKRDLCALNNGIPFQLLNGTDYQTVRSVGCCADRLDYHVKKAFEDYPILQTDFAQRFTDENDAMKMDELPGMDKLVALAGWGADMSYHIPLGFSSSCSYESKCVAPEL